MKIYKCFLKTIVVVILTNFASTQAQNFNFTIETDPSVITQTDTIIVSDPITPVRVYLNSSNLTTTDQTVWGNFWLNDQLIQENIKIFLAKDTNDKVWIDSELTNTGLYTYRILITAAPLPSEQIIAEQTLTVHIERDSDKDGIIDQNDSDQDNDGISNTIERSQGTNPLKFDTDEDGYSDRWDAFPTNENEWLDINKNNIGDNNDPDLQQNNSHPKTKSQLSQQSSPPQAPLKQNPQTPDILIEHSQEQKSPKENIHPPAPIPSKEKIPSFPSKSISEKSLSTENPLSSSIKKTTQTLWSYIILILLIVIILLGINLKEPNKEQKKKNRQ